MWFYLILLYTSCQACICMCMMGGGATLKCFIKKAFEKICAENEEQHDSKHYKFGQPQNLVVPDLSRPVKLCMSIFYTCASGPVEFW